MSSPGRSNGVTIFAFALAGALALALAAVMLSGTKPDTIAKATPTPAITPSPTPSSATPSPTATPAVEASPTPAPTAGRLIDGRILAADGTPISRPVTIFVAQRTVDGSATEPAILTLDESEFEVEAEPDVSVVDIGLCEDGVPTEVAKAVFLEGAGPFAVELRVPGEATLRGRVVTPAGAGIEGVTIAAERVVLGYGGAPGPGSATRPIATTDSTGLFEGRILAAPEIRLSIARTPRTESFLLPDPLKLSFKSLAGETRAEINFVLEEGTEIVGRVLDPQRRPLLGAKVRLTGFGDTINARCDADGRFRILGLRRGTYIVEVEAQGHATRRLGETRLPTTPLEVTLDPLGRANGRVTIGPAGEAPAQPVTLAATGVPSPSTAQPDGSFELLDLPTGSVGLVALMKRGEETLTGRTAVSIAPGEELHNVAVELRPTASISVKLLGTTHHPVAELEASIERVPVEGRVANRAPAELAIPDWPVPSIAMSETGLVRASSLESGQEYVLTVRDRATRKPLAGAVLRPPDESVAMVPLGGTATLRGVVLSEGNTACAGAELELVTNLALFGTEVPSPDRRRIKSSFDGRFEFANVPAGRARLTVNGDEAGARFLTLTADQLLDLTLPCTERPVVRIWPFSTAGESIGETEQFVVMSIAGTKTPETLVELVGSRLEARLAPGDYSIVRTATMETKTFKVRSNLTEPLSIEYTVPAPK